MADFQQVYNVNFEDWLVRPRRLSTRRMYALVQGLDRWSSRFWSEIAGHDPVSQETVVLSGIFSLFAGQNHPVLSSREKREQQLEFERKKEAIKAASRKRKRELARLKAAKQKEG